VKISLWLCLLALVVLTMGCPKNPTSPSSTNALIWNPWNGEADPGYAIPTSGFYITPYPGTSLSSVVVWMIVDKTGSYSYSMNAAVSQYGGNSIGTGTTGSVTIPDNSSYYPVTFTFSGNPGVTKNVTLTFTISAVSVPSGGSSSFCTQSGNAGNTYIYATQSTSPPLGGSTNTGAAVVVNGNS
jgi:hypothetical protein